MANPISYSPHGVIISTPTGDVILNAGANMTLFPSAGMITLSSQPNIPTLLSGTYTPTLYNTTNIAASTAYVCQYMQVGNVVTVSGKVSIDPTAVNVTTTLGMSLPQPSAFTLAEQCGGVANAPGIAVQSAAIFADATNDRATLQYIAVDASNQAFYFSFTYRAI